MPDNVLMQRMIRLEKDVLAYKTAQPIGTDSVRAYTTQTNNIWDVEGTTIESVPGFGYGQMRAYVRFQADNQLIPFGNLRVAVLINGENYNYPTSADNFNSNTTPYVFMGTDWTATSEELNNPSILRFLVIGSAPVGTNIKYKFFVDATDTGRIYWSSSLS